MRQHHAQRPELPVFYNIHSVSNFISLANALLVEIIEAWKSKAMEEISKLWNVKLLSKRVPISNHIKKGVWKDNQDFGQLNVFFTFSFAWECSAGGMPGMAGWLSSATPQTLFFSCRFCFFFPEVFVFYIKLHSDYSESEQFRILLFSFYFCIGKVKPSTLKNWSQGSKTWAESKYSFSN